MYAAQVRGEIEESTLNSMLKEIVLLPEKVASILADKERIQWFANKFASAHDVFFIGRGLDYAICQEGSLKMKEISYIHSEAYAAGELKHGTISLIEKGTLVISLATQPALYEKMISNMVEVKARGGYLMGLTSFVHYSMEDTASTRRPSMWNFSSQYTTLDTKKDFTSGLPKSKIRVVHSGCSFIEGSESS